MTLAIAIIASVIALVLLVLVLAAKLKDERLAWEHERQAWQAQSAGWKRQLNAMAHVVEQQKKTIAQFANAAQRTNRKTGELRQRGSLDSSRPWGDIQ